MARARITPELVEQLNTSVERMKKYRAANDKLRYIEEDINFHARLAQASGNQQLVKALENLQQQVWLFRRKTYDLSSSNAIASHAAIAAAIARQDTKTAEKLMREHISGVCARLVAHLREAEASGTSAAVAQPKSGLRAARARGLR